MGGISGTVNAIPISTYDSIFTGIEEEIGEAVAEDGLPVSFACRARRQVHVDKGGLVDFKVEDATSREGLDIFNFQ